MVDQTEAEFIAEIAALAEKATPGPWTTSLSSCSIHGDCEDGEWSKVAQSAHPKSPPWSAHYKIWTGDAAFISASRTAIPRLLAIIERLEKDVEQRNYLILAEREEWAATCKTIGKVVADRDAALAKAERLTEALKPFANLEYVAVNVGTENIGLDLTVEHFQAARAALSAKETP